MMNIHYILDEQGNPVPEPDTLKWANWFQTAERHVGDTSFGDIAVSTVFLSLPHINVHSGNWTMLYETMVFASEDILQRLLELSERDDRSIFSLFLGGFDIQIRYATREEAIQGHAKMCNFIEVCIEKNLLPLPMQSSEVDNNAR